MKLTNRVKAEKLLSPFDDISADDKKELVDEIMLLLQKERRITRKETRKKVREEMRPKARCCYGDM